MAVSLVAGVADADGVSSTGEVGVGTGTGEQRSGHTRVGGIGGGGGDSGVNGLVQELGVEQTVAEPSAPWGLSAWQARPLQAPLVEPCGPASGAATVPQAITTLVTVDVPEMWQPAQVAVAVFSSLTPPALAR